MARELTAAEHQQRVNAARSPRRKRGASHFRWTKDELAALREVESRRAPRGPIAQAAPTVTTVLGAYRRIAKAGIDIHPRKRTPATSLVRFRGR